MRRTVRLLALIVAVCALLPAALPGPFAPPASAQAGSRYFPETGYTVRGLFWEYWQSHGGLVQQGYPISDPIQETSDQNGQPYTVQYFERAVFEAHPENASPFNVLLAQLGTFRYRAKYPAGAPGQRGNRINARVFPETGHTLGGVFRAYWESHGGLAQEGYPLSDEFTEVSDLNGQAYTVQYFERAVFELHPENAPPFNVQLAQLGTLRQRARAQPPSPPLVPPATVPGPVAPTATPLSPPPAGPDTSCAGIPPSQGVSVTPPCAPLYSKFALKGTGFIHDTAVGVWATMPNGQVLGAPFHVPLGRLPGETVVVYLNIDAQTPFYGIWTITMEGTTSHERAYGYLKLVPYTPTPKPHGK